MRTIAIMAIMLLCALAAAAETKTETVLLVTQYPHPACEAGNLGGFCDAMRSVNPKAVLWVQAKDAGERDVQIEVEAEVNGQPQVYIVKPTWDEGRAWSAAIFRIRGTVKLSEFRVLKLTVHSAGGEKQVENPEYGVGY